MSAEYNHQFCAEALEIEEYNFRVKRARLVAGAVNRNSDRHLRSEQHPEANPGQNRQRNRHSDAAYIPSQRVTQTLHINQEKEQHEPIRNQQQKQRQNNDHHQRRQQQADDSDGQQHREHNNLRKQANNETKRHTPDDESSRDDDSKKATPKDTSNPALVGDRDQPAAFSMTNTIGSNIDGVVKEDIIKQYIESPNAATS